jgi:ankyrin repeat protein
MEQLFESIEKNDYVNMIKIYFKLGKVDTWFHMGESMATWAAKCESLECLEQMVYNNIDITVQNEQLNTALHEATLNQNIKIVKFLLKNGLDPNIQNIYYRTAMDLLLTQYSNNNNLKISKLLLKYGSNLISKDKTCIYESIKDTLNNILSK